MRKGVRVAIKSDSEDYTRRLNQEAAKTMRYGGATEEEALKMITLNPAWIIGVDDRVGSIDVGKDADLVIWDGYPLSSYGVPKKCSSTATCYFDRSLPGFGMTHYKEGRMKSVFAVKLRSSSRKRRCANASLRAFASFAVVLCLAVGFRPATSRTQDNA